MRCSRHLPASGFYYASCSRQCPSRRLGLILPALHGLYGVGGTAGAGGFLWALGLGGGGGGAAAFISRDAEKAVVELEEHAVRN